MGRNRDTARQMHMSEFMVDAEFQASSRYRFDLDLTDAFLDGVRWAVEHEPSEGEDHEMTALMEELGAKDPALAWRRTVETFRRLRTQPPGSPGALP